jgi:hypothetical protein
MGFIAIFWWEHFTLADGSMICVIDSGILISCDDEGSCEVRFVSKHPDMESEY